MKNLTFLMTLLFSTGLFGQSKADCDSCKYDAHSLYVVLKKDQVTSRSISESKKLIASLLNNTDLTMMTQSFPYSKNEFLLRVYKITSMGNGLRMYNQLSEKQETIEHIERCPKENMQAAGYDPTDYFWYSNMENHLLGDLWHLKKIEADKAWQISKGNPQIKIASIDTWFDLTHPDLATKFVVPYDPYDMRNFSADAPCYDKHGTGAASYIAAKTNGGGHLAGIGFNCMIIGYKAQRGNYLEKAHHASFAMQADVLTSSAGDWTCPPSFSTIEQAVVKDILDNGTVIVMPAGNGGYDKRDGFACEESGKYRPIGPLTPLYDERVIVVTSTDDQDKHYFYNNSSLNPAYREWTHSHFAEVDVAAPGYLTMGAVCVSNDPAFPYYGKMHGTSFATPIVAGLAGLIKSVNPCFSAADVQHLIKTTTDPIADEASYSGMVGTGRINAYQAVLKALTYKAQYEQNKTYTNRPFTYVVNKHTILIGYSVTGSLPNGPLTIQTGADVRYTARNYIEAKPGFESLRGSGFEWKIDTDLSECN